MYAALIHDVDHNGVPNAQLVAGKRPLAAQYENKSVAENNSIVVAWDFLMLPQCALVSSICPDKADLDRFHDLVVNVVLATDIVDKGLKDDRNNRWAKVFQENSPEPDSTRRAIDNPDDSTKHKNVSFMYTIAQQIAAYQDNFTYPTVEYLMRSLGTPVHEFFPDSFDWKKDHSDRIFEAVFSYRPSRMLREWRRYVPVVVNSFRSCTLEQVPWYREGYKWFYADGEESGGEDDDAIDM